MTRPKKTCDCCGKLFPLTRQNRLRCWQCGQKVQAGEAPSDICERLAENTRSTKEAARLVERAAMHRQQEEAAGTACKESIRKLNELTVLRLGLKSRVRRVQEPTSNRWRTQKTWRCGRCGRSLDVKRCLACELEINGGR